MMSVVLALSLSLAGPEPAPIPVILTTDFGVEVDDQWALTHLALSPRVDLRAVVTTHAPGLKPADAATAAIAWLDTLPRARKPQVVAGSASALADRKTPRPGEGVDLILRESKTERGTQKPVVFVIGAATDLASALLIDPSLADRVEVVAMGFSQWPEGGDPWNVKNDVKAWQALLDSRVPLVVGDEAVCKQDLRMTPSKSRHLLGDTGIIARSLAQILETWLEKQPALVLKTTGKPDEWPIWDEVTVAHLLGQSRVERVPRPSLRDDLSLDHSDPRGTIGWIKAVDSGALWSDLAACIGKPR